MILAVIPARGGSKRIPRKNVREFAGKPMIAHTIDCARRSRVFDKIIVSTDDTAVMAIARSCGAEVPFIRPAALADDHAGLTEVIAHAVEYYADRGIALSAVCCMYATAPFALPDDLKQGLELLRNGGFDYVLSATSFSYPIFRAFSAAPGGGLEMFFPDHFTTRSQDLPEAYHDAAQFCWGTPAAWLDRRRVFGPRTAMVEIPRWRVQDIDTEEDWRRAEAMASYIMTDELGREEDLRT